MKAISIRQPWAWAIMHAGKRIENRYWRSPPSYRGPLLIHAAKGCTREEFEDASCFIRRACGFDVPPLSSMPRGALVAMARLVGVHPNGANPRDPWAVPFALGLVLDDVRPLLEPISCKGELGLFEVPDDFLQAAAKEGIDGR